jgi:hypothetical protein
MGEGFGANAGEDEHVKCYLVMKRYSVKLRISIILI